MNRHPSFWYAGLLAVLVLAGASLACWLPVLRPPPTPTPAPTPTPHILTAAGVLQRIDRTMVLQTTVFRIDTVVRAEEDTAWWEKLWQQRLLVFVQGAVTAGVDLSELSEENVAISNQDRVVTLTLPPVKVLSAELVDHQVQTYGGELPRNVDLETYEAALAAGRQQIAATACSSGILGYATRDAQLAFDQIFGLVEVEGYTVLVETTPPGDCTIEIE
jgi:hypothetical protein